MSMRMARVLLVCLLELAGTSATAQQAEGIYDRIWGLARLHDGEENAFVQSVLLTGRFQFEHAAVRGEQADHSEWNVRRFRLGVRSQFLRDFTLHTEGEINPQEADPVYTRLTDFYIEWSRSERFALTLGKQGVGFTMDGTTSSKELLTIDRSNLANNMWFPQEYIPGASISGGISGWVYTLGAFSGGRANRAFGEFDGSVFGLAAVGLDVSELLGANDAVLTASYVHQRPHENNTFTRQLRRSTSLNFRLDAGRWGLRSDVSTAEGYLGQQDLWGLMTTPFLNATEKVQLVARHTYLVSDGENGIRLARYENQTVSGRGDRYHELYLGANYYLYGHKLKIQIGAQTARMRDRADDGGAYSGTAVTTGLRLSW